MQTSVQNAKAIESLRDRIAEHRSGSGRTKRYPMAIKKETMRLLGAGSNAEELGLELGIQPSLLYRWRRKQRGRPAATEAKPASSPQQPRVLTVEPERPASEVLLKLETGGFAITVTRT